MKHIVYIGIGCLLLSTLAQQTFSFESSSYQIEQITDVPQVRQQESGQVPVQTAVDVSVSDSMPITSDLLNPQQLETWADVGVVATALYMRDGKKTIPYGLSSGSSYVLLDEENNYHAAAQIDVEYGTQYPHILYAQVISEPRSQKNDQIIPTQCDVSSPCTASTARHWSDSEIGIGYRVDGQAISPDMQEIGNYRSFVQGDILYPVTQSKRFDTKDSAYTLSIRSVLVPQQRDQSYWGHVRMVLFPDF